VRSDSVISDTLIVLACLFVYLHIVSRVWSNLGDGLNTFLADESKTIFDGLREQIQKILLRLISEHIAEYATYPRPHVRHPLQLFRVAVHHTAPETAIVVISVINSFVFFLLSLYAS